LELGGKGMKIEENPREDGQREPQGKQLICSVKLYCQRERRIDHWPAGIPVVGPCCFWPLLHAPLNAVI